LRERQDDIPLLAHHFIKKYAQEIGKEPPSLTPEALDCLVAYPWPGNIRELENIIERALALNNKKILDPDDLMFRIRKIGESKPRPDGSNQAEMEKSVILKTCSLVPATTNWPRKTWVSR
jgi:DNA-binding NtrC family response regulator